MEVKAAVVEADTSMAKALEDKTGQGSELVTSPPEAAVARERSRLRSPRTAGGASAAATFAGFGAGARLGSPKSTNLSSAKGSPAQEQLNWPKRTESSTGKGSPQMKV